ncbi:MAG: hypothetical protein WCX90_09355, partial [Thiohalomonadaceae bacterium]
LFGGIFSFSEGDLHGENFRLLVYVILSKGQARLVFMQRLLNWLNYLLHINNNEVSTDELINEAITWLAEDATELRRSVDAMDRAEASIQSYYTDQHPQGIAASTIIGAGLVVSGLYSFATWLQDKSNEATNKRNESSEELVRIGQGIPGAEKSYLQKRGEMRDIGLEVIQKTTTKVTTDMILTPINPASVGGVILKEAAGNYSKRACG